MQIFSSTLGMPAFRPICPPADRRISPVSLRLVSSGRRRLSRRRLFSSVSAVFRFGRVCKVLSFACVKPHERRRPVHLRLPFAQQTPLDATRCMVVYVNFTPLSTRRRCDRPRLDEAFWWKSYLHECGCVPSARLERSKMLLMCREE